METAPQNCRFLSLVVVKLLLILSAFWAPKLGVPPWSLFFLSKNYRDFEASSLGILANPRDIPPNLTWILTLFWPILTCFDLFCRADLTYFACLDQVAMMPPLWQGVGPARWAALRRHLQRDSENRPSRLRWKNSSPPAQYSKTLLRRNPKGDGRKGTVDRKCHKLSWRLSQIVVTFYDDLWRFMTFYVNGTKRRKLS